MATPNYGYEKRQKELAKKRKKEEKLKAKAERKSGEHLPADSVAQLTPVPDAVNMLTEPLLAADTVKPD